MGTALGDSLISFDGSSDEPVLDGLTDETIVDGSTDEIAAVVDGLTDETVVDDDLTDETIVCGLTDEIAAVVDSLTDETVVNGLTAHGSAKEMLVDRLTRHSEVLDLVGVMIINGITDGRYFSK